MAPGQHVGIYAYNRVEWLEALLACWKIRAVAVNINFRYVGPELEHLGRDAELVALVYERSFLPRVAELAARFPQLKTYLLLDDAGEDTTADDCGRTPLGEHYDYALGEQAATRDFAPRSPVHSYHRDGAMRVDGNHGSTLGYEPNS